MTEKTVSWQCAAGYNDQCPGSWVRYDYYGDEQSVICACNCGCGGLDND